MTRTIEGDIFSRRHSLQPCLRLRVLPMLWRAALLLAVFACLAPPRDLAAQPLSAGVWLIDGEAAVEVFPCDGRLCGRILWLLAPRDPQNQLKKDSNNPDPALRERVLCGLTVFWGLQPTASDRWSGGGFYNPNDGKTYNISAHRKSVDVIEARIYDGIPLIGRTKTLVRLPQGSLNGWCPTTQQANCAPACGESYASIAQAQNLAP